MVQGIDEHECLLVAQYVSSNALAKRLEVSIHIKIVVLQLESQSQFLPKLIELLGFLFGGSAQQGTYLDSTRQKDGGLEPYHFYVLAFLDVVPCLKVHVHLLPIANLQSGLGK